MSSGSAARVDKYADLLNMPGLSKVLCNVAAAGISGSAEYLQMSATLYAGCSSELHASQSLTVQPFVLSAVREVLLPVPSVPSDHASRESCSIDSGSGG